jgi:hypothetical protein
MFFRVRKEKRYNLCFELSLQCCVIGKKREHTCYRTFYFPVHELKSESQRVRKKHCMYTICERRCVYVTGKCCPSVLVGDTVFLAERRCVYVTGKCCPSVWVGFTGRKEVGICDRQMLPHCLNMFYWQKGSGYMWQANNATLHSWVYITGRKEVGICDRQMLPLCLSRYYWQKGGGYMWQANVAPLSE